MTEPSTGESVTQSAVSLLDWVLRDRRAMALVAAFGANLLFNVANFVPFLGPVVEFFADIGFETIALLIAASILRRDQKPLRALVLLGALGVLKTALDGLNLLPEIGSLIELCSELGIDLTQLWFLKEVVTRPRSRVD